MVTKTVDVEVEIELEDCTSVYQVTDSSGSDVDFESKMDRDGDYFVTIDGYVIDEDDYNRLQTLNLIDTEED